MADTLMVAAVTAAVADAGAEMIAKAATGPDALAESAALAQTLQDEEVIRAAKITIKGEQAQIFTGKMRAQLAEG